ncbi:MAG TPA: biotin/lipoyl-binding protein, partial [bacterium]
MKRRTTLVVAGALIIALAAGWTVTRQVRAKPPEGVLEASGRIEGEEVLIASKVGGRVSRLFVRDGDAVKEGQLIAVLRSEELDARLRQTEAGIETARAQVRRAEGELAVLASQLGQARTAVALAQAQITAQQRQAQASLTGGLARRAQARKARLISQRTAPHAVHDAQAAVGAAKADLVRARAARDQAQRDVSRLNSLLEAGAVAVAQVDAARAGLDAASAQVDAAAEQVQRALAGLEQAKSGLLDVQLREEEVRAADAAVDAARSQVTLAAMSTLEVTRQRQQLQSIERQAQIARAGLAAAQSQYQAAVAARDELMSVRQETNVFAPRAGVIVHSVANEGEIVGPGAPIAMLVDLQALWLKVYV